MSQSTENEIYYLKGSDPNYSAGICFQPSTNAFGKPCVEIWIDGPDDTAEESYNNFTVEMARKMWTMLIRTNDWFRTTVPNHIRNPNKI
jgi:hypothetical protein